MKQKIAIFLSKFLIIFYKLKYGRRVSCGKNVIVNHRFKLRGKGHLEIGDNVNMWAHEEPNQFNFYNKNAKIKIGKGTRLNGITCHCEKKITIENNCMIASSMLMDTDFHTFNDKAHILYGNKKTKPIEIKKGVWLAGQSVILKGCKIGEKSVVGFRAVVTKSFPSNVVIAGNPGRIVKSHKG